ncbi:hypothetical protein D3C83_50540 [compost metagenome]
MASIARFNPFDETIDDLFRGFFVRPVSYENPTGAAQFRVDVSENDNAYTLRAEIPGWVDLAVARALAHDREKRFESATEMREVLETGEHVAPPQKPSFLRRILGRT